MPSGPMVAVISPPTFSRENCTWSVGWWAVKPKRSGAPISTSWVSPDSSLVRDLSTQTRSRTTGPPVPARVTWSVITTRWASTSKVRVA